MKARALFLLLPLAACHVSVNGAPAPDQTAAAAASAPGAFHYTRALAPGKALKLVGLNGAIDASPSADGSVDVRAAIRGRNPSKLKIVAREEDRGIVVCVLAAEESPDLCKWDGVEHGHVNIEGDDDARADLFAKVPRGVSLVAGTMNGSIRALSLEGDVRAMTMNGDIQLSTSGVAGAQTMNGSVAATIGTTPRAPLSFQTHNGDVALRLAPGVDAEIDAHTMMGHITATFPMDVESTPMGIGPKSGRGTVGKGGARISAQTMNGNVDVRSGS